ncbi:MAG: hypothetical protein ACFCU5_16160 [Pleurocapsa sp.]
MALIKISELTPTSLTKLNTSETQTVIGGRGRGRGRGLGRWNNFYSFSINQQTNIALVYVVGDNSTIYVSQSNVINSN